MPRLNLKVVGNPLYSDVVDSSPRYAREAIMPSLSTVENFDGFLSFGITACVSLINLVLIVLS